jgi:hypothetical protein
MFPKLDQAIQVALARAQGLKLNVRANMHNYIHPRYIAISWNGVSCRAELIRLRHLAFSNTSITIIATYMPHGYFTYFLRHECLFHTTHIVGKLDNYHPIRQILKNLIATSFIVIDNYTCIWISNSIFFFATPFWNFSLQFINMCNKIIKTSGRDVMLECQLRQHLQRHSLQLDQPWIGCPSHKINLWIMPIDNLSN